MLTWPAGIWYFVIGVASSVFSELENFHGDVVHSPGTVYNWTIHRGRIMEKVEEAVTHRH